MKSRIWIGAVGLVAMTVVGALSSTAGASVSQWNVKASAGFVKLTLLGNQVQLAGGTSEADANSASVADAMGTGICIAHGGVNCPTSTTSDLTAPDKTTTAVATANGKGTTQSAAPACLVPSIDAMIAVANVACGNASATEDANGMPTASGDGAVANVKVLLPVSGLSSSACSGTSVPAATPGPTNDVSQLASPVQSLLDTVNKALGSLPVPAPPLTNVADPSSQSSSSCSVLEGLLGPIDAALPASAGPVKTLLNTLVTAGGTLNASSLPPLLDITAAGSKSTVANSTNSAGDPIVKASASTGSLDVNIMGGMLDLTVTPTINSVTLDEATGQANTHCDVGLISVSQGGADQFVSLLPLGNAIETLLTQLEQTPLAQLFAALLGAPPNPEVLSCSPAGDQSGTSVSQTGADVGGLHILPAGPLAPDGLIGLDLGTTTVSASSTSTTPAGATTSPNTSSPPTATPAAHPVPAAAPAVVPNVTSVHTGEFWSGPLPIILLVGMGLAGAMLIGRRRIGTVARSISPIIRRRGSQ